MESIFHRNRSSWINSWLFRDENQLTRFTAASKSSLPDATLNRQAHCEFEYDPLLPNPVLHRFNHNLFTVEYPD